MTHSIYIYTFVYETKLCINIPCRKLRSRVQTYAIIPSRKILTVRSTTRIEPYHIRWMSHNSCTCSGYSSWTRRKQSVKVVVNDTIFIIDNKLEFKWKLYQPENLYATANFSLDLATLKHQINNNNRISMI